ncbi:hypothetical protein G7Y89_g13895 [Cudoniella acicularis]|uniref:Uncharacterized protein n=1 Tax=Cudoniella acicularis TaxID=354080 RepID=A0A8H4R9R9_9HELO|nr:hypothetical protein G7Y89_g13895 [Cudoniella acicularis]
MAEHDTIAVVNSDWTPWLIRAPSIIQRLGVCMSLAATREASEIELRSPGLEYPDLASNLVSITNQGQNAFIEAYSDMLQISSKTNSMGGRNGKLDDLAKFFGDSEATAATGRILRSLHTAIETCDERGKRTEKDFRTWLTSTNKLHVAVVGAQGNTNRDIREVKIEMKTLQEKLDKAALDLAMSNEETEKAKDFYDATLGQKQELDKRLNSFMNQVGEIGIAHTFGIMGTLLNAGLNTYLSASAAQQVQQAEEELERRRTIARELDYGLQAVEIDLDLYKTEKEGLDHLLGAIQIVLQLLAGLVTEIRELLTFFQQLNDAMSNLVTEYRHNLKEITDGQEEGDELRDADYEQFYGSIRTMKKLAVTVHALASLYANVISGVINPGFSKVIHTSHYEEGSSAIVVQRKSTAMQKYLTDSEQKCRDAAMIANQALKTRLLEIHQERITPKRKRKRRQNEQGGNEQRRPGAFGRMWRRMRDGVLNIYLQTTQTTTLAMSSNNQTKSFWLGHGAGTANGTLNNNKTSAKIFSNNSLLSWKPVHNDIHVAQDSGSGVAKALIIGTSLAVAAWGVGRVFGSKVEEKQVVGEESREGSGGGNSAGQRVVEEWVTTRATARADITAPILWDIFLFKQIIVMLSGEARPGRITLAAK